MILTNEIESKGVYTKNGNFRLNGITYYIGCCERCGRKFYGWHRKQKQLFCGYSCSSIERNKDKGYTSHLNLANEKRKVKHESFFGINGKICRVCNRWKPLLNYTKSETASDKLENRCRSCQSKRALNYYERNRIEINKYKRSEEYKIWFRKYQSEWSKKRRQADPSFKIKKNTRTRIYKALRRTNTKATIKYLGCTIEDYKIYLEELFEPGMTWSNYGEWEIDHILPCASFDLSDIEQCKICFNYKNTQPLWAIDNNFKRAKL